MTKNFTTINQENELSLIKGEISMTDNLKCADQVKERFQAVEDDFKKDLSYNKYEEATEEKNCF